MNIQPEIETGLKDTGKNGSGIGFDSLIKTGITFSQTEKKMASFLVICPITGDQLLFYKNIMRIIVQLVFILA